MMLLPATRCRRSVFRPLFALVLSGLALAFTDPAIAGDFSVSPVRVDFEKGAKSASITVNNEHPTEPLTLQAQSMLWTQDENGKDVYTPTDEINFFPRLATVEAQNSRVFRLGVKAEPPAVEKAYRFFMEETPKAQADVKKSQITVNVRFGAPVFLHPAKVLMSGAVTSIAIGADALEVGIQNRGNMHFVIESLSAELGVGAPVSEHGWYLLPGASRVQKIKLPPGACEKINPKSVNVKIVTELPEFWFQSGDINVVHDCTRKVS